MKQLITRIAIASLVATLASAAALVKADVAEARASAGASPQAYDVNRMPSRILRLDWIEGQAAWREATATRLLSSTFRFSAGGSFTLFQPGYAPLRGRYSSSGNSVRFEARYIQNNVPSGQTTVALAGTLDLRTGRTQIGYEARSILVFCWSGQCMNQNKSMAYRAELVLRRV